MTAISALMAFVIWTAVLALSYATYRVPMILTGRHKASHWERNSSEPVDDPAVLQRAKAAHLNCVENLPLFAAVVLGAVALGENTIVDALAAYVLYARLAQSICHLVGTSFVLIAARATFFLIQIFLMLYMAIQLLG
ncbi:MAPEG family protein [Salinisphaera aquimarina]|uniref:MAPEG family protein n=1 Tax=Salinisphaera aquimarina TaxID=2094031 RepID=A0ABV7ETN8_9GAMM